MPLYKTIHQQQNTIVHVWHITESYTDLNTIDLTVKSLDRLNNMKSELHQKGFLSVRHLLKVAGYSDTDLYYNSQGKPHLKDGKHISITHSFTFSALVISDVEVGIDIEKNREKINLIAHKFVDAENTFLVPKKQIEQLTVIWGAKESLYKIYPNGGLSFKKHIFVNPFTLEAGMTSGTIRFYDWNKKYNIYFEQLDNFTLVYAMPLIDS